ncbi:MAG: cytochrome c biogenesis protein CcsA [candidate division Zixibacteria bacterium]|nr:cytochrome c biogenesis protein CcsA [candidate division Zixibacteria bacterium]
MAHLGDFFIFTAAIASALSAVFYFLAWRGKDHFQGLARRFFHVTTVAVIGALSTLMYLILTHDFSVAYVFSYSSTDLPLHYLIATLWGGQEGTFLLWLFYTVIMGTVMMFTARQFERGNMFFLNLFVISLLLIMIKKSPFEIMPVFREEGAGLNPLLQNFWMTIHPPIMFTGFAGVVFPFVFALTALVERKYNTWAESARRWTMFAWCSLGVSLVLGGYWAYETLGWGGFWAWDPVENSSLIPWIFLTAQVHSLFIQRQRRGLLRFSLFVVCLTFWSVLYGTFLTRSGVLADFSVHSFVDLGINAFLVSGLLLFVGLGSFFLIHRWRDITPEPSYSKVASRSYLVTLGIVILFIGGWLVLLGTSAPLLTRVTENPSNVGLPYYFATMTPLAVALLFLIGMFPAFKWNDGLSKKWLLMLGGSVATVTVLIMFVTGFTSKPVYLALFGAAAWALVVNAYVLYESFKLERWQPGYLSHIGLATAITGAALSAGFEAKQQVNLVQHQPQSIMGYEMTFTDVVSTAKGFDCHVDVNRGDEHFVAVLPHEFPKNQEGVMKKPHVETYLTHDLYFSPASIELPKSDESGEIFLKKGETAHLDKYDVTFHRFEMGNHGESDSTMSAAAVMTVAYDGKTEEIAPRLMVRGNEVTPIIARFDAGRGAVSISGVRPEDGGVRLKFEGSFVPAGNSTPGLLVVELSKKPLIQLFWIGTAIIFIGGYMSMYERRRRNRNLTTSDTAREKLQPVASDAA